MNTDRDPADQQALAAAVQAWIATQDGCEDTHEADIAFEAVLVEQGVTTPDEAVEGFEATTTEIGDAGVDIYLEGGEVLLILTDGSVYGY